MGFLWEYRQGDSLTKAIPASRVSVSICSMAQKFVFNN